MIHRETIDFDIVFIVGMRFRDKFHCFGVTELSGKRCRQTFEYRHSLQTTPIVEGLLHLQHKETSFDKRKLGDKEGLLSRRWKSRRGHRRRCGGYFQRPLTTILSLRLKVKPPSLSLSSLRSLTHDISIGAREPQRRLLRFIVKNYRRIIKRLNPVFDQAYSALVHNRG